MRFAKEFKYEHFYVEISYECPECGQKYFMDLDPGSAYAVMEYGLDAKCDKCGTKFTVDDD